MSQPITNIHVLRVITPVVYFLVLTSVIVHGITIPIGKGFHHARSLTISRSQTANLTGGGGISRLPPAKSLPTTRTIDSGQSGPEEMGPSIRFDLERGPVPGYPSSPATAKAKDTDAVGILSRPGTPPPRGRSRSASRVRKERSEVGEEEMRNREQTWEEGNVRVIESEDGERIRVVHGGR